MRRFSYPAMAVCLQLLILDYILKAYTHSYIPLLSWSFPNYPYGGVGIFQWKGVSFSLNYIQNLGAAWGMFSAYPKTLVIFRIGVISLLMVYLLFINKEKSKFFPLLLVGTGAIGNIIDFFLYGHVVDMLHFRFWGYTPFIFNLADSMISIGIGWLLLVNFILWRKELMPKKAQEDSLL